MSVPSNSDLPAARHLAPVAAPKPPLPNAPIEFLPNEQAPPPAPKRDVNHRRKKAIALVLATFVAFTAPTLIFALVLFGKAT